MSNDYRIIQRNGTSPGDIPIAGTCFGTGTVEARFNGGAWQDIDTDVSSGAFSGTLSAQAQAQGDLQVRFKSKPNTVHTCQHVGFGDVFVVAGQSNAMGVGENLQTYSHATIKAGMFTKAGTWAQASDELDGAGGAARYSVQNNGSYGFNRGTVWIKMLTAMLSGVGKPIGLVPCARDATAISAWARNEGSHGDTTTLYGAMVTQALAAGGVKAVLWWQGESDALLARTKAQYKADIQTLGDAIFEDLGVPLIPCKFLNCSGIDGAAQTAIKDAIGEAWGTHHILAGPDLSDLASDDAFHAVTDTKVATCASRWWTAIQAALYA